MKTTKNNIVKELKKEVKAEKREAFSKRAVDVMQNFLKSTVVPFIQVVVALVALTVLLGLAYKGAVGYLSQMNDTQQAIAAVVAITLLAYCIATGLKRIIK